MSRIYPVTFSAIQIGTGGGVATELEIELYFGSSIYKSLRLLQHWFKCVNNNSLATDLFFEVQTRVLPSVLTNGANGGGTITVAKQDQGDSNPSFTAHLNKNGGLASTSGTPEPQYDGGFYLYEGDDWYYPKPPIIIGGQGAGIVIDVISDVGSTGIVGNCYLSGGVLVEEAG